MVHPALRLGLTSGAALHRDTSVRARLGIRLRQFYGASETGVVTINMQPDPETSAESVGRPLPGVEVTVGSGGEIAVKSPGAATWLAASEADAGLAPLADNGGWIRMADSGRLDSCGRLFLTGRKSSFINVAGYKVSPLEVEAVLMRHADVTKATVVPVRDGQGNEAAKAVVYCRAPLQREEIVAFCRERLAPYKVPRLIEVRDAANRRK